MNVITIKKQSVLDFQKRVQFITRNELLPILSNLKLECTDGVWTLTKNNLQAICIGRVEATGEPATVLIDERIFFGLVAESVGDAVTLSIGEKLVINDGAQDTDLPLEDASHYPVSIPIPNYDPIQITEQHLRAIRIASNFTTPGETAGNFQFVHVGPNGIYGFHNQFFYINLGCSQLPELILTADECGVIGATEGVGMLDLANHHVFFNGGYTYIFTKAEGKALNITGVVERLQLPGKDVVLQREGLVSFCNKANLVSETPLATCIMEPHGSGILHLYMKDANYNRGTDRVLVVQGEPEPFVFNSRLLAPVLRALPYEVLEAKTNQNCFIIEGRGGAGNGLGTEINEWFCFIGMQR